jgi:methionine-rich copper-binding protein CopC
VRRSRVALLAGAVVLLAAAPASAHASLIGTTPKDGSKLAAAPRTVSLTFSENVGSAFVAVTAPDGSPVRTSQVRSVDEKVTASVANADQRGRYMLAYRVVSADGHPVSGTVTFTTTTGRTVIQSQPPSEGSFVHRHRSHLVLGILAGLVAIGLILAPLLRRRAES